ncbi:MAG: lysozyme inhibitor LprI family protein [Phenylobacterium sp.]|uniref:lysozyme inhibitor LprI family protein n=1 Tax=Phenylobacterium sp. TaxID=1871053 RepID=UPI00271D765F|nr:lysozyme inhibitor LprI family protein [Phenylobacterium sp.]MDO8910353.1 lysozyme inhibitor LprI family protein [Phenylobacterium sp.]MDP3099747.1 lysozyme inhibitor LprI family protein [Phenylobacterium sp.]
MRTGLLVVALLLAPAAAQAAPESALDRCLASEAGATTIGQIQCIGDELKVQDARLNRNYAKAMKDLTPEQKAKLRAAQRAWLAFKDADCRSLQDDAWGTLSRVSANMCVLERTIERADELASYPDR